MAAAIARASRRQLRKDYRRVLSGLARVGDLVWVNAGQQRFLLVNGADYVREALVDRANQLVKPDSQTIETGPPAPATADEGIPIAEFRVALNRGIGPLRVPDVLTSVTAAAGAEVAQWRDGMRLSLMPRMRRLAITAMCGASFGSSLGTDELVRASGQCAGWAAPSWSTRRRRDAGIA